MILLDSTSTWESHQAEPTMSREALKYIRQGEPFEIAIPTEDI